MNRIKYKGKELLPPKSDIVFKAIFSDENDKDLLAKFLSDMLNLDIQYGEDVELLNTEQSPEFVGDKLSRLDVRVKTSKNEYINIEIQLLDRNNIIERAILYNAKMVTNQLQEEQTYKKLGKSISLIIVDYSLFKETDEWYNKFKLVDIKTQVNLTDLVEFNFIELPKFPKDIDINMQTRLELWTTFLSTDEETVLDKLSTKDEYLRKAVNKLVFVSEDEKKRYALELKEKLERDIIDSEEYIREKSFTEGITAVARNLLSKNMPIETISEVTGLSIDEIKKL